MRVSTRACFCLHGARQEEYGDLDFDDRHQPIEGVVEVTVTLVFNERVRVLAARFEGVDKKWLCTEIEIL